VNGAGAEILAIGLLVAVVAVAVARPFGLGEAVVAVPAAALLVATGAVPVHAAARTLREIGPTVGFLAAILVFGHLCAEAGVFEYLGALATRASGGSSTRLLGLVVAMAAGVTAVLTLDATVVLLTPVVLTAAGRLRLPARPHAYACTRLANSGSLLLPVSNLTNLLAFSASGLSFGRFAALMTAPWLVACCGEWLGLRLFFRRDLVQSAARARDVPPAPRFALTVLGCTVVGFVVASALHISPAWAACAGCAALLSPRVARRDVEVARVATEASPGFCLFVLALAVVVDGVTRHGLGDVLRQVLPSGTGLVELLVVAGVAALLANLLNNLPATLALVPLLAAQPAWMLAMLVGVNVGPNATYPGSLATLLWRRQLPDADRPRAAQFHRLGVLSVPLLLLVATLALWGALRVLGG
jgi:arsenical pump membrane protein